MQHVARICFVNSCNCLKIANNPCVWHSNFYKLPKKCFLLLYYYANNINNITKGIDKWHPLLLYITQVLVRLLWSPFEYSSNWYLCRCTHTVSLSLSVSFKRHTFPALQHTCLKKFSAQTPDGLAVRSTGYAQLTLVIYFNLSLTLLISPAIKWILMFCHHRSYRLWFRHRIRQLIAHMIHLC